MKNKINKELLFLKILLILTLFFQEVSYTIDYKPIFDIIIIIISPIFLYRNKDYFNNIIKEKYFKILLLFIGLVYLSTLLSFNNLILADLDIITMFTIMILTFVPAIKYYDKETFIKELKIINSIIITLVLVGSIISLVMYHYDYTKMIFGVKFFGDPVRATGVYENKLYGIYSNPNYAVGFIGFAACLVQMYLINYKNKTQKIIIVTFLIVALIINAIFLYLTSSLGSVVITCTTLLLLLYSYLIILLQKVLNKDNLKFLKILSIIFLSIGMIFILINVYDVLGYMLNYKKEGYVYNPVFDFLTKGSPNIQRYGPLTGRSKIYGYVLEQSLNSPLYGFSLTKTFTVVLDNIYFTHSHNDFLQILLGYGYPSFILIIGFFVTTFLNIIKKGWYVLFRLKESYNNQIYYIFLIVVLSIFIRTSIEIGNIYYFKIESMYFWLLFSYLLYINPIKNNNLGGKINDKTNK